MLALGPMVAATQGSTAGLRGPTARPDAGDAGKDGGPADAGDAGIPDGGPNDAGPDGGRGTGPDAGDAGSLDAGTDAGPGQLVQLSDTLPQTGTVTFLQQIQGTVWLAQSLSDQETNWHGAGGLYSNQGTGWIDQTGLLLKASGGAADVALVAMDPQGGPSQYTYAFHADGTLVLRNGNGAWRSAGDGGAGTVTSVCAVGGGDFLATAEDGLALYDLDAGWTVFAAVDGGPSFNGALFATGDNGSNCWLVVGTEIWEVAWSGVRSAPFFTPSATTCTTEFNYDSVDLSGGSPAHLFHLAQSFGPGAALGEWTPFTSATSAVGFGSALTYSAFISRRSALTHDQTYEYFAGHEQVSRTPLASGAAAACTWAAGDPLLSLASGTEINGLSPLGTGVLLGANRGLAATDDFATVVDAGFPGLAFIDAAQGATSLFLLGSDQRIYVALPDGGLVPLGEQPQLADGEPNNHALAVVGDQLVAALASYDNGNANLEVSAAGPFLGNNVALNGNSQGPTGWAPSRARPVPTSTSGPINATPTTWLKP